MELTYVTVPGTWNLKVAPRFLDNMWTSGFTKLSCLCCCVIYIIVCTEENLYCGVCSFKPWSFLSRFPCAVLIRQYPLSLRPNLCCYVSCWSAEWPLKCCNFNTWSLSLEVGTLIVFGKGLHLIKTLIVVEVDTHIYIYIYIYIYNIKLTGLYLKVKWWTKPFTDEAGVG